MTQIRATDPNAAELEPEDGSGAQGEPADGTARLGLAGLIWPSRRQREWCCESCRLAAEPQTSTW